MSNVYRLKRQHAEIRTSIAGALLTLENPAAVSAGAAALAAQIEEMAALVIAHVGIEDQDIYRYLLQSPEAEVSGTAERFRAQMGNMAQEFQAFAQKYATPAKIMVDSAAFGDEARAVFKKLRDRMQREEDDLYPLMARVLRVQH